MCPEVSELTSRLGVDRIVLGHTVQQGRVKVRSVRHMFAGHTVQQGRVKVRSVRHAGWDGVQE